MKSMYKILYKTIFSKIEPEKMHKISLLAIKYFSPLFFAKKPRKSTYFFGKEVVNPIGIAAGFDKNGEAIKGLFNLGFGFVEIGTVTPKPQIGNPKPRIFRVGNRDGIINKMGFPNKGSDVILQNLKRFNRHKKPWQIVGVNIGRNKDGNEEDYTFLIEKFIQEADYITINISSPNTAGLRNLLEEKPLSDFLLKIKIKRNSLATKKPFFLKISPDIEINDLKFIYRLIVENEIEGIIISNTTVSRPPENLENINQTGGLSGKFLKEKSFILLQEFNKINEKKIYVISVGGIETSEDVFLRLQNGANLVQIYTSLAFEGPNLLNKLIN